MLRPLKKWIIEKCLHRKQREGARFKIGGAGGGGSGGGKYPRARHNLITKITKRNHIIRLKIKTTSKRVNLYQIVMYVI